jgi:ribonuclease-3
VNDSTLRQCQEVLGYEFSDPSLLALALTHASVAPRRDESNERLEFLGDAVLGLVVCHALYDRTETMLEGEMTKIKSVVVSRRTCAAVAEEAGLGDLIHSGKGLADPSGLPPSVTGAAFEALVGAIYLDGGLDAAQRFVLGHMAPRIERTLANEHRPNYKSLLQQHAQKHWQAAPEYHLLDEKGPDHNKCFEVAVSVDGRTFSSAWGTNKKEAEQEAARRTLEELDLLPEWG